ncbi:hypothetical protein LF817_09570 [Halobacillus sp. A1]|uniref:hypothetical protein n=1 Tax=Halobacillus sp. A1 TaxID=2880262 RepID=UPI0020A697FA|nr:hypothetical protein [Halobacillus sp. A1]MCP3031598.1 hypothetical protein [Halobacillus sp. A1]
MGIISTKLMVGALATTVVAGGVMFTGGETVDNVKDQLGELKNKITQYEMNENALFEKLGFVKADAESKINDANDKLTEAKKEINNLKAEKSKLVADIDDLNEEISSLQAEIEGLEGDLSEANQIIKEKQELLDKKTAELEEVTGNLDALQEEYDDLQADYNELVQTNEANAQEAERANEELEEANAKVAELEGVSGEVEEATGDLEPMTQEEIDALADTVDGEVNDADLVVERLNLTYIQDGNTQSFKDNHPELDIKDGDRVWRINNTNDFKVYVEYEKGSEEGEVVANPNQTFYMTETGGTMIIKWQDENGEWQQVTKAGA